MFATQKALGGIPSFRAGVVLCQAVFMFSCAGAVAGDAPASQEEKKKEEKTSAHLLQPGDVLEISVHEHPEFSLKLRVDTDGSIRFPLCGKVRARGRTAGQISEALSEKLREANIERAQVFVFVAKYTPRYVYVLGEVKGMESKALEIPPEGRMTALQAVSSVGGFSARADRRNVFVLRNREDGKRERIPVDVRRIMSRRGGAADVELKPGDTVIVPTASPISVFGMVNKPSAFEIDTSHPVSVMEMISRAGGFKEGADRDRTLVLRSSGAGDMKAYAVRMGAIMRGAAREDTKVQPGDVIIVQPRDKIFVLGQVKAAGAFNIRPEIPMTVTRAIAIAGGFDKLAAEDAVLLIRGGKVTRINLRRALRKDGDLSLDQPLKPGDIVFVPESRW